MINTKTISGILLLAGSGTRFSSQTNKVFIQVNGKPIMEYSLRAFLNNKYVDDLIIVTKQQEQDYVIDIIKKSFAKDHNENFFISGVKNQEKNLYILEKAQNEKTIKFVIGGSSRQESVYNALKESKSDIVVIHDGARPVIKDKYINDCVQSMKDVDGATIAVRSKDTIKIADEDGFIINTTIRNNTWVAQTPQCFNRRVLLKCHDNYKSSLQATDDCMILEKSGYRVKIIEGDYSNIKVTTKEDLQIAKQILQ